MVCERDVIITNFLELGILAKMGRRNWVLFLRNGGDAIVDLVREFYSNVKIINGAIRTYVRGTHIAVDEACILEVSQEVPQVQNLTYPPKKNVAMNLDGRELTGVVDFSWAGQRF